MNSSPTPPRPLWNSLLAAVLVAALGGAACTGDGDGGGAAPVESHPTASSPAAIRSSPDAGATEPGGPGEVSDGLVEIEDKVSRRTTSGRVPAYVAVDGASVEARGEELVLTARLGARVPRTAPPGAALRVTFQLLTKDERRLSFDAQASVDGWIASAAGGESEGFPGRLHIAGRLVQMEVERSYVGLLPFRWLTSVAWSKGTSYGFDSLPEKGFAQYP
jgi:hypothetical protein